MRIIGSKTLDTVVVDYTLDNNVGRFLGINLEVSEIAKNTTIEARDAIYFENIFPLKTIMYLTPYVPLTSYSSCKLNPIIVEELKRRLN